MELLLWRWSTMVQITSDLIIAVFFLVLARSVGRVELRAWVCGWLANLAALSVTIAFWLLQPRSSLIFALASALYIFAKTMFVILLVVGARRFTTRGTTRFSYAQWAVGVALFSMLGGFLAHGIDRLGVIEASTVGLCLAGGAVFLVIEKPPAYGWLAAGFGARSVLALIETAIFATQMANGDAPEARPIAPPIATFLAAHSSFDTGAEWLIALGCVLMLYGTIQREMIQSNTDLRAAQRELQIMLDHDQLTGVLSRHSLPSLLREAQLTGAAILFFDLDGFKKINDLLGHHIGDDCLQRFAKALQDAFDDGGHVIRYAGDEFLVIAQGAEPGALATRIETLRNELRIAPATGLPLSFSVGVAHLPAHGDAELAMRAADEAMYRDKDASQRNHAMAIREMPS